MQNEDDLRGLAKVTDFMRAVSFLFLAIHIYWFCYGWLHEMGWTLDIVDRILSNLHQTVLCPLPRSVLHGQSGGKEA